MIPGNNSETTTIPPHRTDFFFFLVCKFWEVAAFAQSCLCQSSGLRDVRTRGAQTAHMKTNCLALLSPRPLALSATALHGAEEPPVGVLVAV